MQNGPLYLVALFLAVIGLEASPLLPTMRGDFASVMMLGLLFLLAGLTWFAHRIERSQRRGELVTFQRTGIGGPLAALLAVAAASALASEHLWPPLVNLHLWFGAIIFFFLLAQLMRGAEERKLLTGVIFASALVVALHGLHQKFIDLPASRSRFMSDPDAVLRILGLPRDVLGDLRGRLGIEDGRVKDRVFSTFLQPNTLAGFLAVIVPVLAGHILDLLRSAARLSARLFAAFAGLCALALMLWCLYETRSKGGALALAFGAGVFASCWAWRLIRHRLRKRSPWAPRAATAAVVVATLCLIGVAVWLAERKGYVPPFRDIIGSFAVRTGYWRAGAKMVEERPILGVGQGNFSDYYSKYKGPHDQASDQAHNDYVQTAAETGLLGLAVYLFLWLAFFARMRRPLAPPVVETSGATGRGRVLLVGIAAGAVIFGMEMLIGTNLVGSEPFWLWPAVLWACWTGFVILSALSPSIERPDYTRIGIVAGVCAFLAHSAIDFDLQVPGFRASLLSVMALGVAMVRSEKRRFAGRALPVALAVLGAGLLLFLTVGFVQPVCRASESLSRAKFIRDGSLEGGVDEQIKLLMLAAERDAMNSDAPAALADLYMELSGGRDERLISASLHYAQRAAEINPIRAWNHQRVGRAYRALSECAPKGSLLATNRITAALREYMRAESLFPSEPRLAWEIAMIREQVGDAPGAIEKYKRALYLDEEQYAGIGKRLTSAERGEIKRRIEELERQRGA